MLALLASEQTKVSVRMLRWPICLMAILLFFAEAPSVPAQKRFDAGEFGAVGDGKTLDTVALQKAMDAAEAGGGGEVELKPGVYLSGALFLKSHTHLILDKGAVVSGTAEKEQYPLVKTRAAGIEMPWPAALLNIAGQTDVSISGEGTIDGNGKAWWDAFWSLVPAYESRGLRWAVDYDVQRPELIRVYQSSNVRIGPGLLLRRSAFWTVHICYSTHVIVNGITIRDNDPVEGKGPSTDGVDIDSSVHVLVEKVDIENNDDGICLKAGMNADGLRVNRPTEHVVIRDSIIREAISGIAIGSDTAGGFRNIRVSGITILGGVRYGIYLKSTHTRGGFTEDVKMSDISMRGVRTALMIDLNYFPAFSTPKIPPGIEDNLPPGLKSIPSYWSVLAEPVAPALGTPHFRDVTLSNIRAVDSGTAISVNAAPDAPLERFTLQNVDIEAQHAGSIAHTLQWRFNDVHIRASDGLPLKLEDDRESSGAILK
jgi:Glycosyl hydrolases family 28